MNSPVKTRPLNAEDHEFVLSHCGNGVTLLMNFGVNEPTRISPLKIGQALEAWRYADAENRPSEIEVIRGLGCLFGHYIVQTGVGKWVIVTDSSGETLGVQHATSDWVIYPLDAISKRVNDPRAEELVSLYDIFCEGVTSR